MCRVVNLLFYFSTYPEFFLKFAFQTGPPVFAWLCFSAGELPLERPFLVHSPLADEEVPRPSDQADSDLYEFRHWEVSASIQLRK